MSGNGRLFLSPPHMNGREMGRIAEAFASNYIAPLGPMVDEFERAFSEYTGLPHCVALSSGTSATHLALRHLGGMEGDGVLASTLTFIGSVTPATFERCETRFVDSDPATWNMDAGLLEQAIEETLREGRRIRAAIPTDLYGQPSNLDGIGKACARHGIPVICDSAEAMGARYRNTRCEEWMHAGHDSWAAVYSFNGNKIMTTSGGGMLASRDKGLIDHARKLSQQARDPVPWYEHTEIGYNYRMSNVLAAIGCGQLESLDERVAQKRKIFEGYKRRLGGLPGVEFMPEAPGCRSNRWLTVALFDPEEFGADAGSVREELEAENIEARPVWKPMHMQPVFSGCKIYGGRVAEELFRRGLCLPSGTAMTESDLDRVSEAILRASRRRRG